MYVRIYVCMFVLCMCVCVCVCVCVCTTNVAAVHRLTCAAQSLSPLFCFPTQLDNFIHVFLVLQDLSERQNHLNFRFGLLLWNSIWRLDDDTSKSLLWCLI